jgi:hypothetical protein
LLPFYNKKSFILAHKVFVQLKLHFPASLAASCGHTTGSDQWEMSGSDV